MPDKGRGRCGKRCVRCWRNRLKHGTSVVPTPCSFEVSGHRDPETSDPLTTDVAVDVDCADTVGALCRRLRGLTGAKQVKLYHGTVPLDQESRKLRFYKLGTGSVLEFDTPVSAAYPVFRLGNPRRIHRVTLSWRPPPRR